MTDRCKVRKLSMFNIFRFLNALKTKEVSKEGNYLSANFFYKTNDGRQFSITESGWHLINENNTISENSTLSSLTADNLAKVSKFVTFEPQYNYLVHPTTIEGMQGDHVLITLAKPDGVIKEDNLEKSKSELLEVWSRSKGYIETLELELVDRHSLQNLPKSAYAKLRLKDVIEEYFSIQTPQVCVVASFSATSKNTDHYRRIMFEIVDTIELKI